MREQRLVFGEVAELYDRHRPVYPAALVDDLIDIAELDGGEAVLEVGAGTGKATVMFAARGIPIVAVEPSAEMAAVARRNTGAFPSVEIEQSDFERWDPRGRHFPLLFSAQAWHWVSQPVGYERASEVLSPNGVLAAFWNVVAWKRSDLRERLLAAYEQAAPDLSGSTSPMHPANLHSDDNADWAEEIAGAEGLTGPEVRHYEWAQVYTAEDYVGLLATTSDIRLLGEGRRAALFAAVRAALDRDGNPLTVPMDTRLCLARRASSR